MKVVLIVLSLFFLSVALRARELTVQEKIVLSGLEKSEKVLTTFHQDIDPRLLTFRDRLAVATFKRGCAPAKSAVDLIKNADDTLEDQSKTLVPLILGCQQSALSMADFYLIQRDN